MARAARVAGVPENDVTLFVLPRAAHCFNYASTRTRFFDRLAGWARSVSGAR